MVRCSSHQGSPITAELAHQKTLPKGRAGDEGDPEADGYFQPLATTSAKSTTRWL